MKYSSQPTTTSIFIHSFRQSFDRSFSPISSSSRIFDRVTLSRTEQEREERRQNERAPQEMRYLCRAENFLSISFLSSPCVCFVSFERQRRRAEKIKKMFSVPFTHECHRQLSHCRAFPLRLELGVEIVSSVGGFTLSSCSLHACQPNFTFPLDIFMRNEAKFLSFFNNFSHIPHSFNSENENETEIEKSTAPLADEIILLFFSPAELKK